MIKVITFDFNSEPIEELYDYELVRERWPMIYILICPKKKLAYIGETADLIKRLKKHHNDIVKKDLEKICIIRSRTFNKSITQDLESKLIKHLAADGKFEVINDNDGHFRQNYHRKNTLGKKKFSLIWEKLLQEEIATHSQEYITNSDLFKYSPYNEINKDQYKGLASILRSLVTPGKPTSVVTGGAGTGKTILAIYLIKLLSTNSGSINTNELFELDPELPDVINKIKQKFPNPEIALVIPMRSFRATIQSVFKKIHGLNSNMVISPAELSRKKFDIVLVDEAHRLRQRENLGNYFKAFTNACCKLRLNVKKTTELEWAMKQSKHQVFFYDYMQTIRLSDVKASKFNELMSKPSTNKIMLLSQMRLKGGTAYSSFIEKLFNKTDSLHDQKYRSTKYELLLFNSLFQMRKKILGREKGNQLCRIIAGYAWKWVSKKNPELYDIVIGNIQLRWNSKPINWINSINALNEVGCIHTVQGYDLNFAGVIFGNDIGFDPVSQKIITRKQEYCDKTGKAKTSNEQLHEFILNIYTTLMQRGISGTYVYVCDSELRKYFARRIPLYNPSKSS